MDFGRGARIPMPGKSSGTHDGINWSGRSYLFWLPFQAQIIYYAKVPYVSNVIRGPQCSCPAVL